MNLKTSLFDKSIIKSDFKRFWWTGVLFMLILALFVLPDAVRNLSYPASMLDNLRLNTDKGVLSVIFAFGLGGLLFSYLHRANSASCIHGLPIKRTTQYLSHFLAAFVILFIPVLISGIVIFIESICLNTGEMWAVKSALKYVYAGGVYILITLTLTAFASLLTGNTIAAYVFSAGFAALPFTVEAIIKYSFESQLYGYSTDGVKFITENLYLFGFTNICSLKSVTYLVIIIAFLFINLWLYKIRSIECYEEIIAFNKLKPVFMYSVAVVFGYVGWAFLDEMFEDINIFAGALPLGIAALIVAFMLNRKSFAVKGLLKHIIAIVAFFGVVQLCFVFDISGYENRVPDISKVASVEPYDSAISRNYEYIGDDGISYGISRYNLYDKIGYKGALTDEKDIDNIIKLHKAIVENKDINTDKNNDIDMVYIPIKYNLQNGRILQREYIVDRNIYADYLKVYYENDVYKKATYPVLNDNKKEINFVSCEGVDTMGIVTLQHIDYDKLIEAFKKDIDALTYDDIIEKQNSDNWSKSITIDYMEYVENEGREYKFRGNMTLALVPQFKNTRELVNAYLKENNQLINTDNITEMGIDIYNYIPNNGEAIETVSTYSSITLDKEEAKEAYTAILNLADESCDRNESFFQFTVTPYIDGKDITRQNFTLNYDDIPDVIKKHIDKNN